MELTLHYAFSYELRKDEIPDLYRLAEEDYESLFISIASNTVLLKAGDFPAPAYWHNRTIVGQELQSAVNKDLRMAFSSCAGFMFLKIDLPNSYEQAIVDTQVVNQERSTMLAIQN